MILNRLGLPYSRTADIADKDSFAQAILPICMRSYSKQSRSDRNLKNIAPLELGKKTLRIHRPNLFGRFFRRERGDDFFEARIAAERVPEGEQL
jgi:hypothetical protein